MVGEMGGPLESFLIETAKKVDGYIYKNLSGEPLELYQASLHIIRSGGKRIRPAMLIASGRLYSNDEELLIPFASSVELIHTFTLVHDDIIDKDELRRGVKTVHTVWGEPIAIVAGDLLFAKAFEMITGSDTVDKIDASRIAWSVNELAKATSIVAEGQALDILFERRKWVSVDEYLKMVYMKTGALLEASAKIGGIVSGASKENVERLGEYARNIGIAFQIRDDYLGLYGKEEEIGKPVFSDIRRGKKTFFVSLSFERGDKQLRDLLNEVLGDENAPYEKLRALATKIEDLGIKREAEAYMERLLNSALFSLNSLKDVVNSEYLEILRSLAFFIIKRER